jgi:nicotinamide-nucleotide amidase
MRAALLVTGDEVLSGRVGERNAGFLAQSLAAHGVRVERTVIVGDSVTDVAQALMELLVTGVDLVCTTGGLGPTADDLTMAAVATATGRSLALSEEALALVTERSRLVPPRPGVDEVTLDRLRRKQATLPAGATVLPPIGSAPGCALTHAGTLVVVLPGPPSELEAMWLHALSDGPVADLLAVAPADRARTFRLWAVFEAEIIDHLETLGADDLATVGTYTREGELEIVVPERLGARMEELLRAEFGDALFATDERHVDALVAELLLESGATLAVGESCTGGGLGARLTAIPGASAWFLGGAITYADAAKVALLGVDPAIIAAYGAVSPECAAAMATGARTTLAATWALSVTGIAGPDGGSPEKPVGLVFVALAGPDGVVTAEHRFRGNRDVIRRRAQTAALHHLRTALLRWSPS